MFLNISSAQELLSRPQALHDDLTVIALQQFGSAIGESDGYGMGCIAVPAVADGHDG
jgi:hypothetical protein